MKPSNRRSNPEDVPTQDEPDWWPDQLDLQVLVSTRPAPTPWARNSTTARSSRPRPRRAEEGRLRGHDHVAGLARPADYGHYGPLFHPDGVASPRAPTASKTAGAGPAAASSASHPPTAGRTRPTSTRPAACSGRSSRSTDGGFRADLIVFAGNCALESMGFETPRLRLRARGHLGARGDLLGPETLGSATSATAQPGTSPTHSARCRWA